MPLSGQEQLMIELLNRFRLDPLAEADRLGIDDPGIISELVQIAQSLAPLAGNDLLQAAADAHSQWMLDVDVFSHTGVGGSSPGDRMADAGYDFTGAWSWGENIGFRGSTGTLDATAAIRSVHLGLILSDGHRANILNGGFTEIGLGQEFGGYLGYNATMVTQAFASSGGLSFLTGVAFDDTDGDGFYSVGEGRSGIVFAIGGTTATSQAAGGYSLALPSLGDVSVTVTAGTLTIDVGLLDIDGNVKLDLVDGTTLHSSASLVLLSGATDAALLGIDDLSLTGNAAANTLDGNSGANTLLGNAGADTLSGHAGNDSLSGGSGDDLLIGGAGSDRLDGGTGFDTADFSGLAQADATLVQTAAGTELHHDGQVDLLIDIEQIAFSDGLLALQPPDDFTGTAGTDTIRGGDGNDTILGLAGFDRLFGLDGNDVLNGGGNADNLFGNIGEDTVLGEAGLDRLFGGQGNDLLDGGDGNDGLYGNGGNDTLHGGSGDDRIYGGGGFDVVYGDAGNDLLSGNLNADRFVFADGHGNDTIRDFDALNRAEVIDLTGVTALSSLAQLMAAATVTGNGVLIDTGGGDSILLQGVALADLDASDFVF